MLKPRNPFDPELNVLEAIYAGDTPLMKLLREYDLIMARAEAGDVNEAAMADRSPSPRRSVDMWWSTPNRLMEQLGCSEFLQRKMGQLSGGQRKRVALAAALIEEPDLLILDEPTNHLSVEGVEWLENRLQR